MNHNSQPTGWFSAKLGDCCDIVSGGTPRRNQPEFWNGTIPWVTPKDISDIEDPVFTEPPERITELGLRKSSAALLPKGAILFSSRAPIGLVAIAGQPMATNQGFKSLVPGSELDSRFLYYALKRMVPAIAARGNGATFKEVSKSVLSEIEISFPKDMAKQRRIASVLDLANDIARKSRRVLELTDQFVRSSFANIHARYSSELFEVELGTLALKERNSFCNGPFGSNLLTSELVSNGIPVIYIRDIRDGVYRRVSTSCVTREKSQELQSCAVTAGDILIAKVGDPPGTAAIYPDGEPDGIVTQDVIRLRANPKSVDARYLQSLLNSDYGRHVIATIIVEATRARFSLGDLKRLRVKILPRRRQLEFANLANCSEALRENHEKELLEAERLVSSAAQRAFHGEL